MGAKKLVGVRGSERMYFIDCLSIRIHDRERRAVRMFFKEKLVGVKVGNEMVEMAFGKVDSTSGSI